jgi:hypothetical protein
MEDPYSSIGFYPRFNQLCIVPKVQRLTRKDAVAKGKISGRRIYFWRSRKVRYVCFPKLTQAIVAELNADLSR